MKIHNYTEAGPRMQIRKVWMTSDSTCYNLRPSSRYVEHSLRLRIIRGGRHATWWLEDHTGKPVATGIRTIAEGIEAAGRYYAK